LAPDFTYTGPINEVGNADLHTSTEGECSGSQGPGIVLTASDLAAATVLCETMLNPAAFTIDALGGFTIPSISADAYFCRILPL
jgi:hypothetical protein